MGVRHRGAALWEPTSPGFWGDFVGDFIIHVGGMRLHEWIFERFSRAYVGGSEGGGINRNQKRPG